MKNISLAGGLALCLFALCCACGGERHFITDRSVREQVERDFREKIAFFDGALPFPADTLRTPADLLAEACGGKLLTTQEAEAMMFLYAYMPSTDLFMHQPEFYLGQVRAAFEAQRTFVWGQQVPELLFRHFVLPPRVNNEDMDSCRTVFMNELRPRLEGLSMTGAALEVNHWCHEKVIYTPTDGRTSGPLAVVARAYGRCGEESVFTVAALRSVGIPARQVYTPRWAHTDDNHAWVEVWVDGAWHYMGACEPEPVLDRAWFTSAAQRAMLATTFVFGRYSGPEEILTENKCYTEVNVLPVYAPTKRAVALVTDEAGVPVEGAAVEFGLYNYAEFYPLARRTTGAQGTAVLTTGMGTLVVQAVKGDRRAVEAYPVAETDTLRMVLRPIVSEGVEHYRLTPPPAGAVPALSDEDAARHTTRLQYEDSVRMAYVRTFRFADEAAAVALADELGLNRERALPLLKNSLNNGPEIEKFLRATAPENRALALDLLTVLPIKDLQEVRADVLRDHLDGVLWLGDRYENTPLYRDYVLQPRVMTELVMLWREMLRGVGDEQARYDGVAALQFVHQQLATFKDVDGYNPRGFLQTPVATLGSGFADRRSREVYGVAMLRSLGVPARIDPVSGQFQACVGGVWQQVEAPADRPVEKSPSTWLRVQYALQDGIASPKYETHYTLQRWEDGRFRTLGLDGGKGDITGGSVTLAVPAGDYRIVTGRRLADGTVLARVACFPVPEGRTTKVDLVFEETSQDVAVIGGMNPEATYMPEQGGEPVSILSTTGRGFFVLLLMDAAKEPSRHLIEELAANAQAIEATKLPVVCLFKDAVSMQTFRKSGYKGLPAMHYGYDADGGLFNGIASSLERPGLPGDLPAVVVADSFGRVFYVSTGYRIGLGDALVDLCGRMK